MRERSPQILSNRSSPKSLKKMEARDFPSLPFGRPADAGAPAIAFHCLRALKAKSFSELTDWASSLLYHDVSLRGPQTPSLRRQL